MMQIVFFSLTKDLSLLQGATSLRYDQASRDNVASHDSYFDEARAQSVAGSCHELADHWRAGNRRVNTALRYSAVNTNNEQTR